MHMLHMCLYHPFVQYCFQQAYHCFKQSFKCILCSPCNIVVALFTVPNADCPFIFMCEYELNWIVSHLYLYVTGVQAVLAKVYQLALHYTPHTCTGEGQCAWGTIYKQTEYYVRWMKCCKEAFLKYTPQYIRVLLNTYLLNVYLMCLWAVAVVAVYIGDDMHKYVCHVSSYPLKPGIL